MKFEIDKDYMPDLSRTIDNPLVRYNYGFHKIGRPVHCSANYSAAVWLGGVTTITEADLNIDAELPVLVCAPPKRLNYAIDDSSRVWHVGAITASNVGLHIVEQNEVHVEYDAQKAFESCFIGPV